MRGSGPLLGARTPAATPPPRKSDRIPRGRSGGRRARKWRRMPSRLRQLDAVAEQHGPLQFGAGTRDDDVRGDERGVCRKAPLLVEADMPDMNVELRLTTFPPQQRG